MWVWASVSMVGLLIVLWSIVLFNCGGTCRPGRIRLSCNREFILYITVNVSEFQAWEIYQES